MRALDPEIDPRSARDAWQLSDPKLAETLPAPEVDEWLEYALWQTVRELQPVWQPALLSGEIDLSGRTQRLVYLLKSGGSAETAPVLLKLLRKGDVSHEDVTGRNGGPRRTSRSGNTP